VFIASIGMERQADYFWLFNTTTHRTLEFLGSKSNDFAALDAPLEKKIWEVSVGCRDPQT
jgi:hypothetical protein